MTRFCNEVIVAMNSAYRSVDQRARNFRLSIPDQLLARIHLFARLPRDQANPHGAWHPSLAYFHRSVATDAAVCDHLTDGRYMAGFGVATGSKTLNGDHCRVISVPWCAKPIDYSHRVDRQRSLSIGTASYGRERNGILSRSR